MEQDQQVKRWSAKKKLEVVLRLLRGDSLDRVSREFGVEISRLEEWKHEALLAMECGLKSRTETPEAKELDRAKRQLGELIMENELLKEGLRRRDPFAQTRSKS